MMDDGRDEEIFTDLVASAVHDVKNSLALVLNSAEHITDMEAVPASAQESLLLLQHEARRANADLMGLLGLFKIERGSSLVRPAVVECEDLIAELLAYNSGLLASRGITLEAGEIQAAEGYFDRGLVAGVLNAVINNTFRFARSRVSLSCHLEDGFTVFRVLDDGEGYGPKMLSNQPQEPGEHSHRSTGLGLFFARRVAELHQHRERIGRVVLTNRPGGCFELWLP